MADNIFDTDSVDKDISARKENPEDKISNQVKQASVGATHVVYEIIYDRSGSMLNMPTAPEALQNFVNQQRHFCKENNIRTKFTLTVFDTLAEKVPKFDNVELVETGVIPEESLKPRGYTRLIDTALERIVEIRSKVGLNSGTESENTSGESEDDTPVWQGIFVILTDGQDNQSRHSARRLNEEIRKLTDSGIQCYFLGANQDAIHSGRNYGFTEEQSLTYNGVGALEAMRSASDNITSSLRQTPSGSRDTVQVGFTQMQREISGGTQNTVPMYEDTQDVSNDYTDPLYRTIRNPDFRKYVDSLQPPTMERRDTEVYSPVSGDGPPPLVPQMQTGTVTPPPPPPPSSPPPLPPRTSSAAMFRKAVHNKI